MGKLTAWQTEQGSNLTDRLGMTDDEWMTTHLHRLSFRYIPLSFLRDGSLEAYDGRYVILEDPSICIDRIATTLGGLDLGIPLFTTE